MHLAFFVDLFFDLIRHYIKKKLLSFLENSHFLENDWQAYHKHKPSIKSVCIP